jgi:hypothetical protein
MRSFIVDWCGPFAMEDVKGTKKLNKKMEEAWGEKKFSSHVLYIAMGKTRGQKISRTQYLGITEQSLALRLANHEKIEGIRPDTLQIWIGKINFPDVPMRSELELVEWAFLCMKDDASGLFCLNKQKTASWPPRDYVVISRFFDWEGNLIEEDTPDIPRVLILNQASHDEILRSWKLEKCKRA